MSRADDTTHRTFMAITGTTAAQDKIADLTAQLAASREREGKLREVLETIRTNWAAYNDMDMPLGAARAMREIAARVLAETGGG